MGKNAKLLTDDIRCLWTKLKVLKIKGNKLYCPDNTEGLNAINPKLFICVIPFHYCNLDNMM